MKYILYARKSSESDDKQSESIGSQIKVMQRIAKRENLTVVKVFQEAKSAKESGREIFGEMVKFIKQGEAEAILCWKFDRLSRNPVDSGTIQWLLQKEIIKQIKTPERDYNPEDNVLLLNIESGMANQYIRDLSRNVKRGILTKLEKGQWPNLAPIGYHNKNGKVFPDKDKAKYVVKAFELYATGGHSVKAISNILFEEGFRSRKGYKYHKSKIHKILSNPFYHGVMLMHGKSYAGEHDSVISKELFDDVQLVLQGKHHSKRKKHFFALRNFLRCNKCGCLLTATEKKGFTYYYCTNGKGGCDEHKKYIRSEELSGKLAHSFSNLRFNPELVEIMYLSAKEKTQHKKGYLEASRNTTARELDITQKKLDRLLEGYCSQVVKEDAYKSKSKELETQIANLKVQLKKIEKKLAVGVSTLEQTKKVFLDDSEAEKEFSEAKDGKKHELLKILLRNATVENQEIASVSYKQPYQILANVPNKDDFKQMRRGRDSNPRYLTAHRISSAAHSTTLAPLQKPITPD
jgi:site-specific DNA recombinase